LYFASFLKLQKRKMVIYSRAHPWPFDDRRRRRRGRNNLPVLPPSQTMISVSLICRRSEARVAGRSSASFRVEMMIEISICLQIPGVGRE